MMAYTWMKLHCKTLDNPKIGFLPDNLWRKYVELMLIAKEYDRGDTLPPVADIAWRLRISPHECNETLQRLEAATLVKKCVTETLQNDNEPCNETLQNWVLTGFSDTQTAETGAKRVADYRERQKTAPKTAKKQPKPAECNDTVTKRYTDMKTCMMHDDGLKIDDDLLRENLAILGLDIQGANGIDPEMIALWANNVDYIPEQWGPGLIIVKMRGGELPPEPEPEPEPEPMPQLPAQRNVPDPARALWKQITGNELLKSYRNAFVGSSAVSLVDDVLTVQAPAGKIEIMNIQLNGQLARTALNVTGREIKINLVNE